MKRFVHAVTAIAFTVLAAGVSAQTYPSKPVRIVVPYTAGGPADALVRGLGMKLGEKWGQQIVVDNRPGANEIVAAEHVAKQPADGYTFLLASDAVYTLNGYLYSKLPYDPVKDFTPVTKLVTANLLLVTRPDFPANSVKEFIEEVRRNPGKYSYGSVGAGGVNHLAMSWFNSVNGLKMEHIPYKGLVQGLQDIVTSRLDAMFAVIGGALPFIQSNKLKSLAVSGKTRTAVIPNVPTFAEVGYPSFDASFYFAVAAPAGTPPDIVNRLSKEMQAAVRRPEVRERFIAIGIDPAGTTPGEFTTFLKNEVDKWGKVIRAANVKIES